MSTTIRKVFNPKGNPPALGPYNSAVQVDKTLYISGQLGLTEEGQFVPGGTVPETKQAMENMGRILKSAGCNFSNLVKTTILVQSMDDFAAINDVYATFFEKGCYPARACFEVAKLPKGGRVEIEAIAIVGEIKDE